MSKETKKEIRHRKIFSILFGVAITILVLALPTLIHKYNLFGMKHE